MDIKQIRTIKLIADAMLVIFIYSVFVDIVKNGFGYMIVIFLLVFCSGLLRQQLPNKYRVGNTFFSEKYKWYEVCLEIIVMVCLGYVFSII